MKEKAPSILSSEQIKNQEDEERLQAFMEKHPELFVEEQIDSGAELMKADALIDEFESKFDLNKLYAITTEAEARESTLRAEAKEALGPIMKVVRPLIEDEHGISPEVIEKLKGRWKNLSRAIGVINSGRLRHD